MYANSNINLAVLSLLSLQNSCIHCLQSQKSPNISWDLIILHNNDMHARFEQTNSLSMECRPEDAAAGRCFGGFGRVAYKVKEFRNGSIPVLYLNAGDTFTGTPWFNLYQDKIVTDFMNLLKPDAICLGNHEFDKNLDGLIPFLNDAQYPILAANLDLSKTPQLAAIKSLQKSTILQVRGVNIGIVGYLTPYTKSITPKNDVGITDEVEAINKETAKLKAAGVPIIIALGHSGFVTDKKIAQECRDIDIVIGGHDNTFLWNGDQPDVESPLGPYPEVVIQRSGKIVPVVQAYAYTKYLGYLKLTFDGQGKLLNFSGQPILLTGDIPADPEVIKMLEQYRPGVTSYQKEILGQSKVFLNGTCKFSECNLGNFITDAMLYAYISRNNGSDWTDASIAIIHSGGIRSSGSVGNFSMSDLITIIPFEDNIVTLHLTGLEIIHALEHSVHRYSYTVRRGEFLQVSGLHVTFNLSQPSGDRVHSVETLCTDCLVPKMIALEKSKVYKIITFSYLNLGGNGYTAFTRSEAQYVGLNDVDAVEQYFRRMTPIYPVLEGRINFIGTLQDDGSSGTGRISIHSHITLLFAVTIYCCFIYLKLYVIHVI